MSDEKKWFWMMDYCKSKGWHPGESWAWARAEQAWQERRFTAADDAGTTGV